MIFIPARSLIYNIVDVTAKHLLLRYALRLGQRITHCYFCVRYFLHKTDLEPTNIYIYISIVKIVIYSMFYITLYNYIHFYPVYRNGDRDNWQVGRSRTDRSASTPFFFLLIHPITNLTNSSVSHEILRGQLENETNKDNCIDYLLAQTTVRLVFWRNGQSVICTRHKRG